MAEYDEEEIDNKDCSDPKVLNKYVEAGRIAEDVLEAIVKKAKETKDVVELCEFGDNLIEEKTKKQFKKGDIARGIAFPTCISKNEIAGHYQPIDKDKGGEAATLKDGDIVKIDLGVHLDGFAALCATTFTVGGDEQNGEDSEAEKKKKRVIECAHTAAECVIRMMNPGTKNEDITSMLTAVAKEYECECLDGVLSHELLQYVIDGEKTILAKPSPERQVDSFDLEPNKVYAMDIVMSTGKGKGQRKDIYPTTIYKRVVENSYQLKLNTSRAILKRINTEFPTYPFSMRKFKDNTRAKAGIGGCMKHELIADYPVLHEKEGEFVAQFKFTCIVRPNQGPFRLCGPFNKIKLTDREMKDEKIKDLLAKPWENPKRKKRKKKKKKKASEES